MSKVSPSSFLEFGRTILAASTTPGLDSMILDLRGNVGGALDFAQNFLGLFLGDTQYAFDLYHQGDYNVQRTNQPKFTELTRYKDIAILTDGMTQSTAEVTTAAMERFHLAHVVGETTRGWGTVENTFPLDTIIDPAEKYSMLLVHSLTLRPDNQPVEGRGVDPDVNIKDANWKTELSKYFTSPSLITALKKVAGTPKAQ
jgi:carboxyl-terminal processing protease